MSDFKPRDLEERTFSFAKTVRAFVKMRPRTIGNIEDGKQLIRSSGSVAANYIEAREALSKKDFVLRIKICRKEAKESRLWLRLVDTHTDLESTEVKKKLIQESHELLLILSSIVARSST